VSLLAFCYWLLVFYWFLVIVHESRTTNYQSLIAAKILLFILFAAEKTIFCEKLPKLQTKAYFCTMKPQKITIVYADDDFVIVNKPPGVLTIPDRFDATKLNLYHHLQLQYGDIFIVHRLDRETSGIVCFARNEAAHRELNRQFQQREVDKTYCVLVQGVVLADEGRIENYLNEHPNIPGRMIVVKHLGKKSITEWKVAERFKNYTLLDANIKTGRQHQIRVHFMDMGHPLAVDPMYAKKDGLFLSEIKRKYKAPLIAEELPLMSRLTLHAHHLRLTHPTTGETMEFLAPVPKDFEAILVQLRKWGK
jgi:23S rRNA pseudouridine1911/1915/1917 synthase